MELGVRASTLLLMLIICNIVVAPVTELDVSVLLIHSILGLSIEAPIVGNIVSDC